MDEDYLIVPSGPPETYCRLCLSETNVEPLLLVVPDGFLQPNQRLVDLIRRYVEIGLSATNDSPCGICSTCRMMLEEFEQFRERCLRCDYILTLKERNVPFGCSECPSRFRFKAELDRHRKSYHGLSYRCDSCEAGFSSQSMLNGHQEQYHNGRAGEIFNCSNCSRIFADANQLQFHERLVHTTTAPVTDFVPPPAKKKKPARKPPKSIQSDPNNIDKPYECKACRIRFSFIGSLTRHLAEKHRNFVRLTKKKKATATVAEVQPSPMVTDDSLTPEVVIQQSEPSMAFAYDSANQIIPDGNNHFPVHNETESQSGSLITPLVIALKRLDPKMIPPIANFEIPLGKFYHALQRQARPDTEETAMDDEIMMNYPSFTRRVHKIVRCDQCLAEFTHKRGLDRHRAIKHDGNFHTCPECLRQFPDKSSLDRHSYQHTNDFPFVCDECPLGFVRLTLLNQHKEKAHYPGAPPQQLFYCPYCSRPFNAKQKVKAHIMFLHSDKSDDLYNLPY